MLRRAIVRATIAVGLLTFGAPAFAQDATGLSSELERTANTTPQEKVQYVEQARVEIAETVKIVARLLEAAKKNADVEAIQCLTSRLTAVRALQVVVDNASGSMNTSLASGEGEKADHELRKVAVAVTKTRMLLAEAQRCGSDQAVASGDTLVTVSGVEGEFPDGEDPGSIDDLDISVEAPEITPFAPPPA